jgi:hypothetical protein
MLTAHRYTLHRTVLLPVIVAMALFTGGCKKPSGPDALTIPSTGYSAAFDAAVEAARKQGLTASMRDRRAGIIETEPRYAGSLLEPWRTDNSGFDQTMENTLNFQRRRARFEFVPAGTAPIIATAGPDDLAGPNVVVGDQQPVDLTSFDGDLELRVWVYLDRAYTRGVKRNSWSQSANTTYKIVSPPDQPPVPTGTTWTPMTRDEAYERRLLAMVQAQLALSESPSAAP